VALGTLVFAFGPAILGWVFVGAVAGLQSLLAVTGYCLGCKLYFLRWWVPSQFARFFGTNDRLLRPPVQPLRRA
jgi:hypothetical protein